MSVESATAALQFGQAKASPAAARRAAADARRARRESRVTGGSLRRRRGRSEGIEHQVDDDARDGDVEPDRIGPPGPAAVGVAAVAEAEVDRPRDEDDERGREEDVR